MSKVVRSVKNVTKGYSSVQVKVRNATSNDPWGPTGTEMGEIAAMTFHSPSDFYEIMDMLDKRLNDKGKNWRHVLKSLKVLDYCLHEGSEMVVTWARKNIYIIKTLREFQYIDEDGRDVGQNVRVSAKELTALILDEDRLRNERSDRKLWKSRVSGIDDGIHGIAGGSEPGRRPRRDRPQRPNDEEDAEYRLAIEASKHEAEEEKKRRERVARAEDDDDDLAKAIKLSKEEEELRRRELEESNPSALFDDNTPSAVQPAQPQLTGYNQGYQQQPAVDWFGNPMDQQQPMSTGYLNNQYAQPTGFQPQQTGYTNGYAGAPTYPPATANCIQQELLWQ
ncbi:EH domain binding protein epsin 2 [Histoplasma capsulatum H143]|uniref:EH domain binding protein epsin 2 n=1 Tax=Ajellomyces capsulatus (strain H143) TaxID=544712 RepID=C6H6M1_AJECH|nr:EH domain binding protein epsin 2 [Histoplasma capsulatum H143]